MPDTIHSGSRWELIVCGFAGHVTYEPDEPEFARRLQTDTALGAAWRCLRCGTFVLGPAAGKGRADAAPLLLRGNALRQAFILRTLAVERLIRAVIIALAAYAVWRFRGARGSLQATFDRDLPLLRGAGFRVDEFTIVHELEKALAATPTTLTLLVILLAGYALIELIEATGLWMLKRWGEYFAVIATSVFLPLEIWDLTRGITVTRVVTLAINVAAVLYLLFAKRLFGLRGGRAAYDEERRSAQLLEVERA